MQMKPDEADGSTSSAKSKSEDLNCAEAASKLLNCVASKNYDKETCIVYLEQLRECIKKQVRWPVGSTLHCTTLNQAMLMRQQGIVDFTIISDTSPEVAEQDSKK